MPEQFQVNKQDFYQTRIVSYDEAPLGEGEVRLKVDKFAFTANNLTYAATGDTLGYWQFFPAVDDGDNSWGVIPVWAFADVVESNCAEIPVGDRLYGYFPPASTVVMLPQHISDSTFIDGVAHRQQLPPMYNRYNRVKVDPNYNADFDAARALLGPLHLTAFCLADQLISNNFYDADQVVIVSASSKTSFGLAHGLQNEAPTVVGLTSSRNKEFVAGLAAYEVVVSYDDIAEQLANKPTVVVDMAGNPNVKKQLKDRLGDNLQYYIGVGLTHWDELDTSGGFGGKAPANEEIFFAPSYMYDRLKEWGPKVFEQKTTGFVIDAAMATLSWMEVDTKQGIAGLAAIYNDVCEGTVPPTKGLLVAL